jgi:tetratricopeptide (TPR) repeat protein
LQAGGHSVAEAMIAQPEATARLERLRGFLEVDPKNASLLKESADLALRLGLAKDAQGWLERALGAVPEDSYLLASLASAKLALGEPQAALELLEPLVKANETSVALRYNYGYALLRVGRYAEARDALAAIVENPEAPSNTRQLLVRALHFLGEVGEAIEHAKKIAEAHPDDPAAAGTLSLLYVDADQWAEARRWSELALKGQPENLDALLAAGTVAIADEHEDDAQKIFEKALEKAPRNGRAWAGLGTASMLKLDIAGAREHFARAVEDMPNHVTMLNALAWCQMLVKDYAAAHETLKRSLAVDRTIGDTHGALAMLAVFQGRWDEADLHAKRARGLAPDGFGGRMVEILKLQSGGQGELARQKFESGLRSVAAPGGGTLADMLIRTVQKRAAKRGIRRQ